LAKFAGGGVSVLESSVTSPAAFRTRIEPRCGGGPVEQHDLPKLRADAVDFGQLHAVGDSLQREIIELDIAVDLACDAGDEVGRCFLCVLVVLLRHLPEDGCTDRAKAEDEADAECEQPFRWHRLRS
jgi:hypothetical protein